MIVYNDSEADAFTKEIVHKQGFGTLQAWLLDPNPQKHAQLVLDHFHLDKEPPTMIYDVGCGTGEMLYQAGERFPHSFLFGLNRFGSQTATKALGDSAEIKEGDFETFFLFDGKRFDLIMCNYTLGHFEHPEQAIGKMRSLLSPRGKLCMFDICRRSALWDNIYGYHLASQRQLRSYMWGFRDIHIWVPNNVMLSPVLDDAVKQEFMAKTLPVFIIGEY